MRSTPLLLLLMVLALSSFSQSMIINKDGGIPDASAILDIRSTDKGVLIPRMKSTERLAISSPAQALLVFQTDGTTGFYYYNGASWDTLGGANTVVNVSNVTNIENSGIAVLRDVKSSGTDGGTFTSGSWETRDLNKIKGDTSFVSLSSNEFTLDSGTYVISASAPAYQVGEHQLRLYCVTDAAEESVGKIVYSSTFSAATTNSFLTDVVTVSSGGETFRIEHRGASTNNTDGFGRAGSWGDNVYTEVKIQKL